MMPYISTSLVVVGLCIRQSVSLCIDRFSPEQWLLWISNVEIWTSTMAPRHSKTLETFCQNESIFWEANIASLRINKTSPILLHRVTLYSEGEMCIQESGVMYTYTYNYMHSGNNNNTQIAAVALPPSTMHPLP